MGKLYDGIDSAIMKGVNEGVRAWNWTTGRTKSDLANICYVGSSLFTSIGSIHLSKPVGYVFTPICLIGAYIMTKTNIATETKEIKALEQGLKDPQVERKKEINKQMGPFGLGVGALLLPGAIEGREVSLELCIGNLLNAADCYIMRAENFPRRKNVFSRAADNLNEMVSQYQLQRQPITVKAYSPEEIK